jgi:acetoin utilization deacetylase AcuC-like enzyme
MSVYYSTHASFANHYHPQRSHPERPERIESVWQMLQEDDIHLKLLSILPAPANKNSLVTIHSEEHIDTLAWIAAQEKAVLYDSDTYALPQSYEIARLAVGSVTGVIDAVMQGEHQGIAAVRPPGHHATSKTAMGFCLLNNIALGAQHAITQHNLQRVAIVDYDVHHGNGTQDIFYEHDDVLFISTHQAPFYPGTGTLHETGRGKGDGYTLNVPMPSGVGDDGYAEVFDNIVLPALQRFDPEFILVSAGFDAHWVDPLAMMNLSLNGFDRLNKKLISMAQQYCEGRIVFVLEGGYDLKAVGGGVANIARRLLGHKTLLDPYGKAKGHETSVASVIKQVRALHQIA